MEDSTNITRRRLSVLQFCEAITGVRETNISDWRRRTFGDLTAAFRFDSAKADCPKLPDTAGPLALVEEQIGSLPKPMAPRSNQVPPLQEKGTRRQIPLS